MKTTTPSLRTGHIRPAAAAMTLMLALLLAVAGFAEPAVALQGRGSAGSSGTAGVSGPPTVQAAPPPNSLPGIDVSHWQGTINWAKVAADGQRFVIAKATDGRTFDDPMYATNKAEATAAGLAFTAYHFARPDGSADDAILEADHFVQVAGLGPGNLLPALDIEVSGGLGPKALTAWALAWLGEVRAKLGVKPMVYTSPNGWETRFGDTTAIADAGYTVLWVAHWGVSSPTLPANDWSGHGWSFWQYTNCGSVPGISGCVDLDWYDGTEFGPVTIRGLTVSLSSPDGVVTSSPVGIVCGDTCSANFDPGATVTLTATPNLGAVFTGWGGACGGTGSCTVTMDADRSVTATFVTDLTPPSVALSAPTDLAGSVTAVFNEIVHNVTPSNVVLRVRGADSNLTSALACRSPKEVVVSCSTGNVVTVELRPTAALLPGRAYTAIVDPAGAAPVVDRAGNPAPTTSQDFDAPSDVEQDSVGVRYEWGTVRNRSAYGRSYAVEHLARASVSFTFRGRKVTWFMVTGPSQGKAEVSIDGRSEGTFNQYASGFHYKVGRTFKELAKGDHTITVTVLGRKGSTKGTDRQVAVDAFQVGRRVTANPALEAAWRRARSAGASGGSFSESDVAGASVSFRFWGTGVDWYTLRGPDQGRAQILVDGTLLRTVDGYAADTTFGVVRSIGGLAEGVHTVRIVATGTSRRAATGSLVSADRFVVP